MKLALIIPDRGDRPRFFENSLRMLQTQTLQPDKVEFMTYAPESDDVDITQRYRRGYDNLRGKGFDLIGLWESDDWYHPTYLETMVNKWDNLNRPDLFGTASTIYYHLELKAYFRFEHISRSSAMNTFIKPDMDFKWCVDMEPFADMHLWSTIPNRMVFQPQSILSIGCKHGIGKTIAGGNHVIDERVKARYLSSKLDVNEEYPDGFLKTIMDAESFDFYYNYFK